MVTRLLIAFMLFTLGAKAQTIYVTDQNIFDLVPDRDAISGLAGAQRIKASFWENNDYDLPLDVAAALPITLTISSTVDDYTVSVLNSETSTPPNVVWWVVPFLNAGTYRAQATAVFPDDQFPVFDRFLTLTNVPVQPTSFFLTNEVTVGAVTVTNIFGDTIITNVITSDIIITNITQFLTESNTVVYTSGVSSVSVTGAVDGALTFEGNAVTQTGTTFNFSYVDTDTDDGFTNIVTEGSGNVVTNLVYGGRVVTQQLGTVSGGGGGLDHWASDTGTATQVGSWFYPTNGSQDVGFFVGTNGSISSHRPDGTSAGGNARGAFSVNLGRVGQTAIASGDGAVSIGGRQANLASGIGAVALGGSGLYTHTASGNGSVAIGGEQQAIASGRGSVVIGPSYLYGSTASGTASAMYSGNGTVSVGFSSIFGGQLSINNITGGEGHTVLGGWSEPSWASVNSISGGTGNMIANSARSTIINGRGSFIIGGVRTTNNTTLAAYSIGHNINNNHNGAFAFASNDGSTNRFSTSKTNSAIWRVSGGFGINTNNPQVDLHVAGEIRSDAGYIFPDGSTQTTAAVSGGGGLDHWASDTGTATQVGSWFYPTNGSTNVGFFVGTNGSVSLTKPDGTVTGGESIGINSISLVLPGNSNRADNNDVIIGAMATGSSGENVAIGYNASASGYAVAIGINASSSGSSNNGGTSVGEGTYANLSAVAIGANANGANSGDIAIGQSANASGFRNISIGLSSVANGGDSISIGANQSSSDQGSRAANAVAIGESAGALKIGSIAIGGINAQSIHTNAAIITGNVDGNDKLSQGDETITLSFNQGLYLTQTNTVYASITPSGYSIGGNNGITVTQTFLDASSNIRTNIYIGGILVSGYTE